MMLSSNYSGQAPTPGMREPVPQISISCLRISSQPPMQPGHT